jgi:transposase
MTEKHAELSQRLVIGHKRDGRSCYDKEAKRDLIEACLQPGVSIARMALQHGLNANLLRTWITRHRRQRELTVGRPAVEMVAPAVGSAFVPVVATRVAVPSSAVRLGAQLPNGIKLDLSAAGPDDVALLLRLLCELPCSGSTPG